MNRADCSEEQVGAWAPGVPGRRTLVAEERGEVVSLCVLEGDGHLDMLYVETSPLCLGRIGRPTLSGERPHERAI